MGFVRFSEFAEFNNNRRQPGAPPSSLFALLYLDPLAKLDPVAAEVRESRAFAERMAFLIHRFPLLIQAQVSATTASTLESEPIERVIDSTETFASATDELARTIADYPAALSEEREAALNQARDILSSERDAALKQSADILRAEREGLIKQVGDLLTTQQSTLFTGMDAQQQQIRSSLELTDDVMDNIRLGIKELSRTGPDTVLVTEDAMNRLIDRVFKLALVLIVVVIVGTSVAVIVTRRLTRRPDPA
jgi:ElaB/YqjD/DUF883 family membrane-anchored ribosome-binding protein